MDEIDHIWEENRQLTDKAQEAPRSGSAQSHAAAPELRFSCPHCQHRIACDEAYAGAKLSCPGCHKEIEVPSSPALRIAARLGMDLNNADDAATVRRVLHSADASRIILRDPRAEEEIETALRQICTICAIAGALLGWWTANQPGVSLVRDFRGREVWSGHSIFLHMGAGIIIGLVSGFVLYWLGKPVRWLLRQLAGESQRDKWVQFGLDWGRYLGMGVGGLVGAIRTIGATGTLWRERFPIGFFFGHSGERGFLVGGFLGGLCLGLIVVLLGKYRFKRRRHPDIARTSNIERPTPN